MALTPRTKQILLTYTEINEAVQVLLARHKQVLIREGLTPAEAWAFCQRIEERVMVRLGDLARSHLKVEGLIESVVLEEIQRRKETGTE